MARNLLTWKRKLKTALIEHCLPFNEGDFVCIIGESGGGKTTLCHLIPRFYDVNSGSISIDGTDIRDISRKNLRNLISMVLQDVFLFNGTILDNILYGRLDASFEEVVEAEEAPAEEAEATEAPATIAEEEKKDNE